MKCGAYPDLDWLRLWNEPRNVVDIPFNVLCRKMMGDNEIGHGRKLVLKPDPTRTRMSMMLEMEATPSRQVGVRLVR